MAYTKRGFADGNVLYAYQLIAMEDAIIKNENDIKNIELTPGADGITPHIGDNGNWFIGDTDTGVKAEGKDGKDGKDGVGGSGGSGGSSAVYSTEETVVGTWIDGKPIYRIILPFVTITSTSNDSTLIDVADYSIDTCVTLDGWVIATNGGRRGLDSVTNGGGRGLLIYFDTTNNYIMQIVGNTVFAGRSGILILEYTKTTDTATNGISTTALMDAYEEGVNEA